MDYIQLLTDSVKFTWKYKALWVLGLIYALTTEGVGSGSSLFSNTNRGQLDSSNKLGQAFTNESLNNYLLVILVVSSIFIVLGLIFWYLSAVARAGMVSAVVEDNANRKVSLRSSWRAGGKYVLKFFTLDVLVGITAFVASIPAIAVVIAALLLFVNLKNNPSAPLLLCCLVIFAVIYFVIVGTIFNGIKAAAERALVIKNMGAMAAFKLGWKLLRKYFGQYVLAFLVHLIPSTLWGIVGFVISLITVPLLLLLILLFGQVMQSAGVLVASLVILLPAAILWMALVSFVAAPFATFSYTYWTKFIIELFKHE